MAALHTDLLAIREKSGLSVSDVNKKTKTPESVILEIEKGSIFDKSEKQKTYIRSFIRTYAKAIGIKDEDMIRALDAQESGNYAGGLRKKYLPETLAVSPDLEDPDEVISPGKDVAEDDEDFGLVKPGPTSTIGSDEYSRPDPSRQHNRVTPPPPKLESVDWARFSDNFVSLNNSALLYVFIAIIIVILGVGGYYGYEYYAENVASSGESGTPITSNPQNGDDLEISSPATFGSDASDSLNTDSIQVSSPEIPASVTAVQLPDTIFVIVHAANDKLEPIRVTSDVNNSRSPYWIEVNEAMRFDFYNQIAIEGQLDRMAIFVNGHLISEMDSIRTADRNIVITRDFLSRRPYIFSEEPPDLPEGVIPPTVIRDRPFF
ncbi:MAG TPA: hypothetical protein DCE78_08680 [Bacteroidetes bacterium]|nr:hypothetical protein [Bacteroidota bacterium]